MDGLNTVISRVPVFLYRLYLSGDMDLFKKRMDAIYAEYEDLNCGDTTMLHWMYEHGNVSGAHFLYTHYGLNPHRFDRFHKTPLMLACKHGKVAMVKYHFEHFPTVFNKTAVCILGHTASMKALAYPPVVELVIANDALDPNVRSSWVKRTHLQEAIMYGYFETADLLIALGKGGDRYVEDLNDMFADITVENGFRVNSKVTPRIVTKQLDYILSRGACLETSNVHHVFKPNAFLESISLCRESAFVWFAERGGTTLYDANGKLWEHLVRKTPLANIATLAKKLETKMKLNVSVSIVVELVKLKYGCDEPYFNSLIGEYVGAVDLFHMDNVRNVVRMFKSAYFLKLLKNRMILEGTLSYLSESDRLPSIVF
jgi:hypothetical protein